MKSSALILNVFVSLVAFVQYYRAGHFRWNLFWPFAIASIPLSYIEATLPHYRFVVQKAFGGSDWWVYRSLSGWF